MSTPQNFRAAFNGFNRDDVVNYISFITSKHENQINQLRAEADELRQELENRPAANETLEQELERLREEVVRLQELVREKDAVLEQQRREAVEEAGPASMQEQELEAYRRAESAERRAMERVEQMFDQANGILGDVVVRLLENTNHVNEIAEQVRTDLEQLEDAAMNSKTILEDSAAMMAAIKH